MSDQTRAIALRSFEAMRSAKLADFEQTVPRGLQYLVRMALAKRRARRARAS